MIFPNLLDIVRPTTQPNLNGYILRNQIIHSRQLPVEATHSFTYTALSFLISLDALENNSLDLARGWAFGYGGRFGRLTGLQSAPYLTPGSSKTVKQKLADVLHNRGHTETLEDVWMLTMPSYLGFEGINPLTVYFCYRSTDLWLVVLEVHNTFNESHVYVLEVNEQSSECTSSGYEHEWTFPRAFHVSPFNDRSGFYKISLRAPGSPPGVPLDLSGVAVSVHIHSITPDSKVGPVKLKALLRVAEYAPLTTVALLQALSWAPFSLFLSLPRILYQAWILHYQKRLDVYIRPEPYAGGGGARWIPAGTLENLARKKITEFIVRRSQVNNVRVTLVAGDLSVASAVFGVQDAKEELTITYLASRFFVVMLLSPSAQHALLAGEGLFTVSSTQVFEAFFCRDRQPAKMSSTQKMRQRCKLPVPKSHFVDDGIGSFLLVWMFLSLEWIEKWVFGALRARIVPGDEPWLQWQGAPKERPLVGSVLRQ